MRFGECRRRRSPREAFRERHRVPSSARPRCRRASGVRLGRSRREPAGWPGSRYRGLRRREPHRQGRPPWGSPPGLAGGDEGRCARVAGGARPGRGRPPARRGVRCPPRGHRPRWAPRVRRARLGDVLELFPRRLDAEEQLGNATECHHGRTDVEPDRDMSFLAGRRMACYSGTGDELHRPGFCFLPWLLRR